MPATAHPGMLYDPLSTWRSDAAHESDGALPGESGAGPVLRLLPRYLAAHAARARGSPLPPLLRDPLRQRDLLALGVGPEPPAVALDAEQARAACEAYGALCRGPARDEPWVEQWLLHALGYAALPDAVPFWLAVLDHRPPGDTYAVERRTYALAALAYLCARRDESEARGAYEALARATAHPRPDVRAAAAVYLVAAYRLARRPVPLAAFECVTRLARDDGALECRLVARQLLDAERVARGADDAGRSYVFAARRAGRAGSDAGGEVRVVLRSAQTLAHLDAAVRHAAGLACGRGFVCYLAGLFRGGRYEFGGSAFRGRAPGESPLSDLGLLPGHAFGYAAGPRGEARFDLGLRAVVRDDEAAPSALGAEQIVLLETQVNGTRFHEAPALRGTLRAGDALVLQRDPHNSYDDRAVEVRTAAGAMLGFVPRTRNRVVAALLDAGEHLVARLDVVGEEPEAPYLFVRIVANAGGEASGGGRRG